MPSAEKDNAGPLASEFEELKRRCEQAGLEYEEEIDEEEQLAFISFKAGRKDRLVAVGEGEIGRFLAFPFEKYSFIGRYDAICCYSDGLIEAALESPAGGVGNWRRLAPGKSAEELPDHILSLEGPQGETASIGKPSGALRLLARGAVKMSMKVTGIPQSGHDQALEILEKVSNSLLFDLDGRRGVPLVIGRRRTFVRPHPRVGRREAPLPDHFPKNQFDPEPMALYWYARSAARMPLLQFLAYYQILEFYFDLHFQAEARRRIRNILRDPAFNPFNDRDLTRVLLASRRDSNKGGSGSERSQLRSTVRGCAEPDQVRDLVFAKRNKDFFERKKMNSLTSFVLKAAMSDDDLLDEVANRLYDIRCKIVHTKDEGPGEELNLLLPFSAEAEELGRDTEILHMISRAALISGSNQMQLPRATTEEQVP